MKREGLLVVCALALALDPGLVLGQDNATNRSGDLNVSITLESASESRAAVADLALPIEQESRSSPPPPEQERRFVPADFARPNLLESLQIAASDLPRGTMAAAVRCQAFIGADGGLGDYFCTADDNGAFSEDVVQVVIDAVPTQRFVAARVDGQAVRVLMNFAVYFDCSSGSCLAVAARNHGYHIETLGLDYVDPQPIVEGENWYEGFDYKLRWLRAWMPRIRNSRDRRIDAQDRMPYLIAAEIDASGVAAPACLYWVGSSMSGPPGAAGTRSASRSAPLLPWLTIVDIERAVASFGRVGFVPGMIDGAPATLRLYEQGVTKFDPESGGQYSVGDIDCENASQSRAVVTDLAPEQESRLSPAPLEQERRFEPADFARPNRLESIQVAPGDLPRGTAAVAVRCQVLVGADSGLGDYDCVSDDNIAAEDVVHAVLDAVPTQRFVAARVDGQNVRVLMNFAVYIDCSSGSCLAVTARNHGYHLVTLGLDYVDPQPILAGDNWYEGYDYKLRYIRASRRSRYLPTEFVDRMTYVMAAEIDASGIAGPGCLAWVGVALSSRNASNLAPPFVRPIGPRERAMSAPVLPPLAKADIKRAMASLSSVRYVPGIIDGAPTALRLYEETMTGLQSVGDNPMLGVGDIDCK
jgi:hypothetical protein